MEDVEKMVYKQLREKKEEKKRLLKRNSKT